MDDQAQGVEARRRRTRAEAEQVAGEYEGSGLSRVEFCRKHGLSLATLARYRKRQAQGKAGPRRSAKVTHFCSFKVTHTENTIWNAISRGADYGPALSSTPQACRVDLRHPRRRRV